MNDTVIVAIITVAGSLIVASITFYLTKRHELAIQWRNEKLNHYKVLLSSISDLAVKEIDQDDANRRYFLAINTIYLVAPQYVINALMDFQEEVKLSNKNRTIEKHDELLRKLILAIRKDIGLSKGDIEEAFNIHLIGTRVG